MTELEELKARVRTLEDIESIRRLRNKYSTRFKGKVPIDLERMLADE